MYDDQFENEPPNIDDLTPQPDPIAEILRRLEAERDAADGAALYATGQAYRNAIRIVREVGER